MPRLGKKYISIGKFLGFLALITIPAMPLYAPIFCERDFSWRCNYDELDFIFIPIFIAFMLGGVALILLISGKKINNHQ